MSKNFLTAEWRKLAMANYEVDPEILQQYLPAKTELDLFNGKCFVSLIGFRFLNTRLKGIRIPFHSDFDEVNLRFYVTYNNQGEKKRGVVFVKEIVPKPALTWVANTIYKEKYETMKMKHRWEEDAASLQVEYYWKKSNWNSFMVVTGKLPTAIMPASVEEFITENYWGYTKINDSKTSEYGVHHPKWEVYEMIDYKIDVDFGDVYGNDFRFLNQTPPTSVFLAEGSEISVQEGRTL
jgi:uncharacterized protein